MYKAYKVPTKTENNSDKPDIRSGPQEILQNNQSKMLRHKVYGSGEPSEQAP